MSLDAPPTTDTATGGATLLTRRARDVVKGPTVACAPDTPIAEAARLMSQREVGSIMVCDASGAPLGIVTDRDLRSRVVAPGLAGEMPVRVVMSAPVRVAEADCLALEALLEMTRLGIHHLGVVEGRRLLGVISSHDLLGLQAAHPVAVAREVERASGLDALAAAAQRVVEVVRALADGGTGALEVGRLVAELNDRIVRRALILVEAELKAGGAGAPPASYSWLVAGSEGRREQTFKTDQDNALVYDDPPPTETTRCTEYFRRLTELAGTSLARLGFPPCPGGFMASNPRWCRPASQWREEIEAWMARPHPASLVAAAVFLDMRPVRSDQPGLALWSWVCERAPTASLFLRFLAQDARQRAPGLGFFGGLATHRRGVHRGLLDIKAAGILPVGQALRVYGLSLGTRDTGTLDRLRAAEEAGLFSAREAADLRDAYRLMARIRLEHQLACLADRREPDNWLAPATLGKADRLLLREAFKAVDWLQRMLEDRFQTYLVS